MPTSWPDDLYGYNAKQIVHLDIAALDLDNGKWFKRTYCKNPKDPEGKFLRSQRRSSLMMLITFLTSLTIQT